MNKKIKAANRKHRKKREARKLKLRHLLANRIPNAAAQKSKPEQTTAE